MSEFSISAAKKILKSQGDKRVSEDAAKELRRIMEQFAGDVSEEAIAKSKEDGLKTVKGNHVREALS